MHADIPPALRAADEVLLVPHLVDGSEARPVHWHRDRNGPVADLGPSKDASQILRTQVTVHAFVDLATRDVVSEPTAIPQGAVLAFRIGIEPPAWDEGPVAFVLSVIDGARETVLHRQIVDPSRPRDRSWRSVRIDLGRVAGATVRFRFAARPASTTPGQRSLPVWADPTLLAPPTSPTPFNVVLVSLDTLRAASVGTYGCARDTTPYLDGELARQGTTFERAIAPAPHTLPSHMSLFTAVYPRSHGLRRQFGRLGKTFPTLAEALRRAGYETTAFTEDGFLIPEMGFRRGFATYTENPTAGVHARAGVEATFRRAVAWMRSYRDRPFFLFVHTYQVHEPYTPPPDYVQRFGDAVSLQGPPLELLRYEQEVRYTDDALAALMGEVDGLGLGLSTLVVVLSDHGEEFFEHGAMRHGAQVYDEAIHVPLLLRLPGVVPAGHRVATPVSLIDVTPTILDLVGLPLLPGAEGRSVAPLLATGVEPGDRTVFSDVVAEDRLTVAVRTALHTCIFPPGAVPAECFDGVRDPREDRPMTLDPEPAWLTAVRASAAAYREGMFAVPSGSAGAPVDSERRHNLRALGYVE